jgi:[NiFe] hydrogenase assembly HybE family chaperone
MQELEQKLEGVFSGIERQRMRDVPVCNPALQVAAVGFREWKEYYLGVMLTPWFMNLMLLPKEPEALAEAVIGSKRLQVFPSGGYEFVVGEEAELGRYLVCSLFSPVFEFSDQATALAVASMSLEGLMDEANKDTVSSHEKEISRIWHGEQTTEEAVPEAETIPADTHMSRREFLRGRARGDAGHNAGD